MSSMSKRERVLAALRGDELDRPPVSFWGHDFLREWTAEGLAAATLEAAREHDYDYVKVNPRATYYAEAWGCRYRSANDPAKPPIVERWVLEQPSDLANVRPVDATGGPFAEALDALRQIGDGLRGEVPYVQTVFSPLSVVGRMAKDRASVKDWMRDQPEGLEAALSAVTETLAAYAAACLDAGADGIFFPTTEWGTHDACTVEQYNTFGRPFDLQVLKAVEGAGLNIFHVCRANNMLDDLLDYPAAVVHWDVHGSGNPSFADEISKTDKAVMGGLNERETLLTGTPDDVRAEVQETLRQTGGRRLLVAPGCSISPLTPPENLRAAVEAVKAAAL